MAIVKNIFCAFVFLVVLTNLSDASALTVESGTVVELVGTEVYSEVVVRPSAEIRIRPVISAYDKRAGTLEMIAHTVIIESEGGIKASNATGGNLPPKLHPESYYGFGGSYGGYGGAILPEERNPIYGDVESLNIDKGMFGIPGGYNLIHPGNAGGALVIRGDTVIIDGVVESNGGDGTKWRNDYSLPEPQRYYGAGGGSGGGILIVARELTIGPNARITANGGDGGEGIRGDTCAAGYPGGGGRIKIFYEQGMISENALIVAQKGNRPEFDWATGNEPCLGHGGATDGTIHIERVGSVEKMLNPGDMNGDGKTDFRDLFELQRSWHKEITPIPTAEPALGE